METNQLQTVLNSMTEGILVTNEKQEILLINLALRSILNFADDCVGKKVLECVRNHPLYDLITTVLRNGLPKEQEITLFQNGEEKCLRIRCAPLELATQRGSVSVFNDVTELRQLENVRKEFVANISHELKTPLTNIRGFAETLGNGALKDPQRALPFLKKIENNAIQLQNLVEDILKLSEIESGRLEFKPTPIPLKEFLENLREDFSERLRGKEILWEVKIPPAFELKADQNALEQILRNLVDNAIKYTPEGGKITITAIREPEVAKISIADTGIGISPQDLSRVFERFYRVDKSRSRAMGGTGLGLAIVKHLVQAHGGEVTVESQPEVGSKFFFTLPQIVS